MTAEIKIKLANIEKYYPIRGREDFHALKNINLEIEKGCIYGIIGRSGAGKSSLIRLINLLERPTSGQVIIDQTDITKLDTNALNKLRQKIGLVFQHFNLLSNKTVLDNVILPLRIAGVEKAQHQPRALELLRLVGLEELAHKYPNQLSGGQKQRVGIARALANNPEILLCDEATSALDPETTKSILALLKEIAEKLKITIVLITHSMDVIRTICDKVAVIDSGEIIERGDVVDVFLHPQQETTKKLLAETGMDPESWSMLKDKFSGHVIRLTYKSMEAAQPILSHISLQLGVEVNILQGTVGSIGSTLYGQLVVSLDCDQERYAQVCELLRADDVVFEELR